MTATLYSHFSSHLYDLNMSTLKKYKGGPTETELLQLKDKANLRSGVRQRSTSKKDVSSIDADEYSVDDDEDATSSSEVKNKLLYNYYPIDDEISDSNDSIVIIVVSYMTKIAVFSLTKNKNQNLMMNQNPKQSLNQNP
jgi:hypothetical protein